jgi:hypothetical protein
VEPVLVRKRIELDELGGDQGGAAELDEGDDDDAERVVVRPEQEPPRRSWAAPI